MLELIFHLFLCVYLKLDKSDIILILYLLLNSWESSLNIDLTSRRHQLCTSQLCRFFFLFFFPTVAQGTVNNCDVYNGTFNVIVL